MKLSHDSKKIVVRFLLEKLNPDLVYLFGSLGRGIGREESDLDLAFYDGKEHEPYTMFLLANQLAQLLRREVDLVDLGAASTVFRAQVITTGELLYYRDRTFKEYYEMRVLKEYAKLNEERQVILDAIREEGSVYNG